MSESTERLAQLHYEHRIRALGLEPKWDVLPERHRRDEIAPMQAVLNAMKGDQAHAPH